MNTNSFALPGLLASLLVGLVLLLSGVQPGTAERTNPAPTLFSAVADTQHIHLTPGWNYVGARVTPDATDFELLFSDLAEVPLVSDGNDGMYYPASSVNTTGAWDTQRGYFVYAEAEETLVLEGAPLSSETIFSLEAGWNLVPFVLQDPMDAEEAFAGIADNLLMAKDEEGQTYIPESGINAIGTLRPGRAYQLFVSQPVDLTYSNFPPSEEFVYDSECLISPNAYRLHDYQDIYGALTRGPLDRSIPADSVAIANNTALINGVINDLVGPSGGGVICLPQGRYDVAPSNLWDGNSSGSIISSIFVDHSNITLWGAGRDEGGTGIYSNGTYVDLYEDGTINGIRRGSGITIGKFGRTPARTNITLRDFELNGQGALPGDATAYTGCDNWQSRSGRINCWDTTHKGINTNRNGAIDVDNLFIERVAVRSFKGELLYSGGRSLGYIELNDIISEDTNAQALNLHGDMTVVQNSHFGLSMTWMELFTGFEYSEGVYTNNTFEDCHKGFCITFSQGDGSTVPFTFEDNYFTDCGIGAGSNPQVFGFAEGTDGPIEIRNNQLDGCGMFTRIIGGTPGQNPTNILIENNNSFNLTGVGFLYTHGTGDITVRNNTFSWTEESTSSLWTFGWASYTGLIEGNTFTGSPSTINMDGGGPTMRPLVRNNSYPDISWTAQRSPNINIDNNEVRPNFEQLRLNIISGDSMVPITMRVGEYTDGQRVELGPRNSSIVLVEDDPTYEVSSEAVLSSDDTITLAYDASQEKWIEVSRSINE